MEAGLGEVLRWHITSRSTLADALYRYDALGRIHAHNLGQRSRPAEESDIGQFLELGPLGTALLPRASDRPRALLIDEIDKSDLDLPSDLLDVLERGSFEIPELSRHPVREVRVRTAVSVPEGETGDDEMATVTRGRVAGAAFPFIVMTSNGERDFPAPFLRRCIRFDMPPLDKEVLASIVTAHLDSVEPDEGHLIAKFAERLDSKDHLAIDQLLNAVLVLRDAGVADPDERDELRSLLLRELGRA